MFAETNWRLSDRAHLRFGARWTDERKAVGQSVLISQFRTVDQPVTDPTALGTLYALFGYENHELVRNRERSDTTVSVIFQYDMNPHRMLYASYASGFKSGGFNEEQRGGNVGGFEFQDEEAASIEIGGKFELAGGAGRFNIAVFDSTFDNLQTSTFDGTVWIVSNAAAATSRGVELEGVWRPTAAARIGGSFAFLDSRFDEHRQAPCVAGEPIGCVQDLSGRTTNFAPDRTTNLYIDYLRLVGSGRALSFRLDANYTDGYYFAGDLDPSDYQYAHTTYDGRIAIGNAGGTWEVALIGRNLTNKRFPLYRIDVPLMTGAHFAEPNAARSWMIQLIKRFR